MRKFTRNQEKLGEAKKNQEKQWETMRNYDKP